MALSSAIKQLIWYKNGIAEMHLPEIPCTLRCINRASIDISENPRISERSRHIDIAYHYTRERLLAGDFSLIHVPSIENLADICTKPLTLEIFHSLSQLIRG